MKYYTFGMTDDLSLAFIDRFEGIGSPLDLDKGVRMGENFRPTVKAYLDKRYGDLLTDFLSNTSNMIPISEKMKGVFEGVGFNEQRVEYLPFELYNIKKRLIKKQYYVANALERINCIDRTKSILSYNDENEISRVKRLYIQDSLVPHESCFFRLGEAPEYIVIREDLVNHLMAENISGLTLIREGERIW